MYRPRRAKALASVSILAVLAALVFVTAPAQGAASSNRQTSVPVRFDHRTPALRDITVRRAAPNTATTSADRLDVGIYRMRQEKENEDALHVYSSKVVASSSTAPSATSVPISSYPAGTVARWEGLNHFDQRYSGGGNQFSLEPPDQGMCAGNGFVMEDVNDVVQVYRSGGQALIDGTPFFPGTEPVGITLNAFFGLDPEFVRPDGPFGPFSTDPTCYYDAPSGRWFAVMLELDIVPDSGDFAGPSNLYIGVSTDSNPTHAWNVYTIDTSDNGENGTPDHHCSSGYCYGDYPQIGSDANGFFITTNEFDNLGAGEFHAAQVYALSKADLVAGVSSPSMVMIENVASQLGIPAYTLQPVNARPVEWDTRNGGTQYFGMTFSPFVNEDENVNAIDLWALSNTSSLDSDPDLLLSEAPVGTQLYNAPGHSLQAPGPTPLLACENDVACIGFRQPNIESPIPVESGSAGKVFGAWLHDGVVYLTTDTNFRGTGAARYFGKGNWYPIKRRVGVAYFGLEPSWSAAGLTTEVTQQGYVAVSGANIFYPAIAIRADGEGAIAVTLTGPDYYPSAAYVPFTVGEAPSIVRISGIGIGPDDGFTGTADGGYRPRWGDYGAATVTSDGTIWLASEYIAQRCSRSEFNVDVTCGFRRSFFANWSTHITAYRPG